jgi:hypothetical protein
MRRTVGALVIGLGLGLGAGIVAGRMPVWPALVLIGVGAVLLGLSVRDPARSRPAAETNRPTLAGLNTRVTEILRLAEEQAQDHVREAQREAEQIVAEARMRAGQLPG